MKRIKGKDFAKAKSWGKYNKKIFQERKSFK